MHENENIIFFLFASSLALIIVVTGFVLFVSLFFRAKRKSFLEKQEAKLNFQKELNKVSSEIQTQTLDNIGRELHDNIGQLLAVTKIHADNISEDQPSEPITEMSNILGQTIQEVRYLSQSLNKDRFEKIGFEDTLTLEAERINKLKGIQFNLTCKNEKEFELDKGRGLILFRIIQEFISNTLKYSRADQIDFSIEYSSFEMTVEGRDNGVGFDMKDQLSSKGSGILNMNNRAKLIGAILHLKSEVDVGTSFKIIISKENTDDV